MTTVVPRVIGNLFRRDKYQVTTLEGVRSQGHYNFYGLGRFKIGLSYGLEGEGSRARGGSTNVVDTGGWGESHPVSTGTSVLRSYCLYGLTGTCKSLYCRGRVLSSDGTW